MTNVNERMTWTKARELTKELQRRIDEHDPHGAPAARRDKLTNTPRFHTMTPDGHKAVEVWHPPAIPTPAPAPRAAAPVGGLGTIRSSQEIRQAERKAADDAVDPPGQWAAPTRQTPEAAAILRERQTKQVLGTWEGD